MKIRIGIAFMLGIWAAALMRAEEGAESFTWEVGQVVPEAPGRDFTLSDGSRFYLEIVENRFRAMFFDPEVNGEGMARVAIEPPHAALILRGEETRNRTKNMRSYLKASGDYLQGLEPFYPPYDYWLLGVVPQGDGDGLLAPRGRFLQL